jgi:hypothetical protein
MPIEYRAFMNLPLSDIRCPRCGVSSNGFMRGQVQRSKRLAYVLWRRPYCAIICHVCKDIIGWESPEDALREFMLIKRTLCNRTRSTPLNADQKEPL